MEMYPVGITDGFSEKIQGSSFKNGLTRLQLQRFSRELGLIDSDHRVRSDRRQTSTTSPAARITLISSGRSKSTVISIGNKCGLR